MINKNMWFLYTIGLTTAYDAGLEKSKAKDKPMVKVGKNGDYPGGYAFPTMEHAYAYIKSGKVEVDFAEEGQEVDRLNFSIYELYGNWETDVYKEEDKDHWSLLKDLRVIRKVQPISCCTAVPDPTTELFSMCDLGCLPYVEELIESGVDANSRNGYALQQAAQQGHLDVVEYLTEKGADINANNPTRLAFFRGHLHVTKFLYDEGAEFGKVSWYDISMIDDEKAIRFLFINSLINEELYDKWLDLQAVLMARDLKKEKEEL